MELFSNLLNFQSMPHGYCLRWLPSLLWTHVIADVMIAVAYFSIPTSILYFVSKRQESGETMRKYWWLGLMFAGFILSCGITHIFGIITIWQPVYGIEGLLKVITGVISLATAATLIKLTPQLLSLRSAEELEQEIAQRREQERELKRINQRLQNEVLSRQRAQEAEREALKAFQGLTLFSDVDSDANGDPTSSPVGMTLGNQLLRRLPNLIRRPSTRIQDGLDHALEDAANPGVASLEERLHLVAEDMRNFTASLDRFASMCDDYANDPMRHIRLRPFLQALVLNLADLWDLRWENTQIDCADSVDVVTHAGSLSAILVSMLKSFETQNRRCFSDGILHISVEAHDDQLRIHICAPHADDTGDEPWDRDSAGLSVVAEYAQKRLDASLTSRQSEGRLCAELVLPRH